MTEEQPAIDLVDQTVEVYGKLQINNKTDDNLRLFLANLGGISF